MLKYELGQEYQHLLKKQSLRFAKNRAWDSVSSIFRLDGECSSFEQYLIKDGIPDARDEAGALSLHTLEQPAWQLLDALPDIRQQIFSSDDKQLSGLTYTLFADGTFKVEYDFSRTQENTAGPVATVPGDAPEVSLQQLDGLLASQVVIDEQAFLQRCRDDLVRKNHQAKLDWGLGNESLCDIDLSLGLMTFNIDDEIVLRQIQVVGVFNPHSLSFKWAIADAGIPLHLQHVARQVHAVAVQHYHPSLLQPVLQCNEEEAWNFAAVACHIAKAEGAYRAKLNGEWLYVVFFDGDGE